MKRKLFHFKTDVLAFLPSVLTVMVNDMSVPACQIHLFHSYLTTLKRFDFDD